MSTISRTTPSPATCTAPSNDNSVTRTPSASEILRGTKIVVRVADQNLKPAAQSATQLANLAQQSAGRAATRASATPFYSIGARLRTIAANSKTAANQLAQSANTLQKVSNAVSTTRTALNVLDVGITVGNQYANSTAQTTAGKVVDAGLAGGVKYISGGVPAISVIDAGIARVAGDKNTISNTLSTSVRATTTLAEAGVDIDRNGLANANLRGVQQYTDWARSGNAPKVIEAASNAGQTWADKGFFGTLQALYDSYKYSGK